MTRTLDDYVGAYQHVVMQRDDAGVLEVRLHTDGGPLIWGAGPHSELGQCFGDIAGDPGNRVVLLTGTGDRFIANLDSSWVGPMSPDKWDAIFTDGRRLLTNLLQIEVPVVAAVNGPARVHAELAVLSDIVIASSTADFQDSPHFRHGTVPGDGVHVIWPLLLGINRGRHFLLTGRRLSASEALDLGVVSEVVDPSGLMERARQVATGLARQPDTTLRYTRVAMTQTLKQLMLGTLGYGLALEGLGAYGSWPTGSG
jgi:enoyl-CoA hydratase/carnithine racemase